MDEAERISNLALNLLALAGGSEVDQNNFYFVLSGGADDIIGMCVSDTQLGHWLGLGAVGERVNDFLKSYEDNQERAYRCRCYDADTISCIIEKVGSQSELCFSPHIVVAST